MTACPASWYARMRFSLLGDDAPLLEPGDDALHRGLEVRVAGCTARLARREDRRLVADVREIGAGEAGGLARDALEVDVRGERLVARVDAEDRLASGDVRRRDVDLPVEAAGRSSAGSRSCSRFDAAMTIDLVARAEAVELDEQLVQGLVVLAVEAAARRAPCRRRRARR